MAQKSDKKGMTRGGGKAGKGGKEEDEEDYGDYVTRCICGYTHDDGFMVQCDGCSVWQHVECITINPNNLPDKYLCEVCQPRPVDRKRARQLQHKKREDISDLEENTKFLSGESRNDHQKHSPHPSAAKRRRKQSKDSESKPSEVKKTKKEKMESRKGYRKPGGKTTLTVQGGGKMGSIQSLLNAATLLEGEVEGGKGGGAGGGGGWRDLWSADSSPWCDKYNTAEHNRYSDPVRQFISQNLTLLKSEAVVYSQQEYSLMEGHTHSQCCVAEAQRRRMGVLAQVEVPEDELVVEYKGKVAVKQAVLADLPPGTKSLWKHRPCPFVYLYDKISGLDLCIDAREYGNLGRFIRRSCSPNAELRHFFVNSEVHFGVYATHTISVREEITLPFDFRYEKCDYPPECACSQKGCPVLRLNRGKRRGRTEGGERGRVCRGGEEREEEQMSGQGRGLGRPHPSLATPPIPQDEDSNSSWTSTGSRKKTRSHTHLSVALPLNVRGEGGSRQNSRDVSSESEDEGGGERKKRVKSREDRKAEAVMKMFQRMEASSLRKRRPHTSEGSVDSDSMSPSTLHPAPLTVAYRAQKERRGSSSSRKTHPLPPAKMRLSSVSSNEGLSMTDLPDTFSPPITPGFPPELHSYPSPLLPSPYTLPSPHPHTPSVRVTPFLHPKYLLAQFPLPLKKALLKQWESEHHNKSGPTKPHPLWPRDHMTITSGYITTAWAVSNRPRARGTLKHRWLRQYSQDLAVRGDKENKGRGRAGRDAPLKKMILLRWQEKATPGDGDLRPPHTQALRTAVVSSEKTGTSMSENLSSKPPQGAQDKCQSPLFEEFSDDEFEVVKESRASGEREAGVMETTDLTDLSDSREGEREGVGKMEDMGHLVGDSRHEEGEGQESGSDLNISNISDVSDVSMESKPHPSQTPPPPATPPNAVNVSDISSDMDLREESVEGEEAPPPPLISSGPTTMEGGKAAGKEEEEGRGGEREEEGERLGGGSHRARSLEEVMLESQGRGVEEEGGRREMRGGKSLEDLLDSAGGMGEFAPEMGQLSARKQLGIEGREGEGGGSLTASPETKEGQAPLAGTPLTPAGGVPGRRKKINLTEYRSRARKPVEQRKEVLSSDQAPSPQHPSSFLSHPYNPSQLAYSMLLPAAKGVSASLGVGSSGGMASPVPQPQFEPVSPDEMEPMTSQVVMEASAIPQQPPSLAPAGGGGGRVGVPAAHLPPGVMAMPDSAMAHQPSASFIQPGTHSGGQYGMEPLWNAPQMEPAQDPRRHLLGGGGDMFPHGGLLPHPAHPTASHVMMSQPGPTPSNSGDLMPHPPDYSAHQPHPPHGYVPTRHQHRPIFHPRHPGASGGFY